jgi:hypothetical protein
MSSIASIRDAAGVLVLRREIYSKPTITPADLSRLLQAGRDAGDDACNEFDELLAEAATDVLVHRVDPSRYVQRTDADWLIAQLENGGRPGLRAEYRMLLDVIRYAVSVPVNLVAFTVAEIERSVITKRQVSSEDLKVLRIAVYAATEGSSLHATRESPEALLRMAHETVGASNAAGFDDFAAKAVGNYLMGIAFHWTPKVTDEKELEAWLDEKPTFGSFLKNMFSPRAHIESLESETKGENLRDAQVSSAARDIDASEVDWLLAHLTRDGRLTASEVNLLEFLKKESGSLPPRLAAVLERQAPEPAMLATSSSR